MASQGESLRNWGAYSSRLLELGKNYREQLTAEKCSKHGIKITASNQQLGEKVTSVAGTEGERSRGLGNAVAAYPGSLGDIQPPSQEGPLFSVTSRGPSPGSPPQPRAPTVQKMSHGLVVLKMNMELCGTIALPVSLFSFFRFFFSISSSSSLVSASFKGLASPSVLLLTAGKQEPLLGLAPRQQPGVSLPPRHMQPPQFLLRIPVPLQGEEAEGMKRHKLPA